MKELEKLKNYSKLKEKERLILHRKLEESSNYSEYLALKLS